MPCSAPSPPPTLPSRHRTLPSYATPVLQRGPLPCSSPPPRLAMLAARPPSQLRRPPAPRLQPLGEGVVLVWCEGACGARHRSVPVQTRRLPCAAARPPSRSGWVGEGKAGPREHTRARDSPPPAHTPSRGLQGARTGEHTFKGDRPACKQAWRGHHPHPCSRPHPRQGHTDGHTGQQCTSGTGGWTLATSQGAIRWG